MTDSPKIERITRSLAFMLRHQPDKFDLEVDAHGFAEIDEVVRALNERLGEPVDEDDVHEAVESGDRRRYETQGSKIRALYGHSIPVEPGTPARPPEVLYVAIPERDAERATRFGLRGGRRRFLHLALSVDDARETGRRAARAYSVLRIRALDAWEEGINFYDRLSLWLAEEVPTHLIEVEGTFADGTDPERRPRRQGGRSGEGGRGGERRGGERRGGRRDGHGRGRGRGRRDGPGGDRERPGRGRNRDRTGDREREREPAPRERVAARERTAEIPRPGNEDRDRGRERPRERGRDNERPTPAPERVSAAPPARPRPQPRSASAGSSAAPFGSGILEPATPDPPPAQERAPAPSREPVVEPAPEKKPDPKPEPKGPPSFGAGL